MKRMFVLTVVVASVLTVVSGNAAAQKITAEEIVAKNLESIGKSEDRAKLKNITAAGLVAFSKVTSNAEPAMGKAVFASEDAKSLFAMSFQSPLYPGEKVIFDGKEKFVDFSSPGVRSGLGDYIFRYDVILTHNLLGGVLQKGWLLGDFATRGVKVGYEGSKKIDGREAHVLSYAPKKGSDIRIKLYFDKETYRHVRTEYLRTNSPGMGNNPNTSSQLVETHENMTEDFSDFKTEAGVTLPRTYKIKLYIERRNQTYESTYVMTFSDFYYNSALDPATFKIGK